MNPGEVVWIDFPGVVQTKRRPAVILSSASYHSTRPDVIVGLITSQIVKASAPTDHVLQDWQATGLRVPSAFRAFFRSHRLSVRWASSRRQTGFKWHPASNSLWT